MKMSPTFLGVIMFAFTIQLANTKFLLVELDEGQTGNGKTGMRGSFHIGFDFQLLLDIATQLYL